jgi:hypothetical protein
MSRLVAERNNLPTRLLVLFTLAIVIVFATAYISAAPSRLDSRALKLSDNTGSAIAQYEFSYQTTTLDAIQTVVFEICSNDPFPGEYCAVPNGLDMSNAELVSQSGDTAFTLTQRTGNRLTLSRPPSASNASQNRYQFRSIINPSDNGTYFARIMTFIDNDTNNEPNNAGGLAFAITGGIGVSALVPPYITFCVGVTIEGNNCQNVSGNYVNFGELSNRQAATGRTQMLAATNARDGYTIRVAGTTMTAGNNVINELTTQDVSRPGASQFGLNLRANSSPQHGTDVQGPGNGVPASSYGQINFYRFNNGEVVALSNAPDDARKYTSAYIVNVPRGQAPGIYVSTITYIALGSF